jgi:hypothetical protein
MPVWTMISASKRNPIPERSPSANWNVGRRSTAEQVDAVELRARWNEPFTDRGRWRACDQSRALVTGALTLAAAA